jgi:transcriptional regulator with PAS, ATPase and Fis domain
MVQAGTFRQDLFYRLRVLEIAIPALQERPEDIIPLMNHFLSLASGRRTSVAEYFDESSIQALTRHSWSGNAREIAMIANRAHISLTSEGRVRTELGFPPETVLLTGPDQAVRGIVAKSGEEDILRSRILVALEETGRNRSATARRLGISRPTLYRWMEKLGIVP